jgi:hypothetical protein
MQLLRVLAVEWPDAAPCSSVACKLPRAKSDVMVGLAVSRTNDNLESKWVAIADSFDLDYKPQAGAKQVT